jgi:hypothetical protein
MTANWLFTKRADKVTGQLPNRLRMSLTRSQGWTLVKELLLQLEENPPCVELKLYGEIIPDPEREEQS